MISIFKRKPTGSAAAMKDLTDSFELNSFPSIIMAALSDLRVPDRSLGDIARKLEGDPAITVKILRMVNAAAFGLSREVANLHTAATMTGHARLEAILLAHAVEGALPFAEAPGFNMAEFWSVAAQRACLARNVAARLHPSTQVEAFTAGLLQDMAVPVLVRDRNEDYGEILAALQSGEGPLHRLETARLGFNHADLGGHMAKLWNLPAYLVDAIANHHHEDGDTTVEPAVRIASVIELQPDLPSQTTIFELAESEYGLDSSTMEEVVARSVEEAEDFAKNVF